MKILFAAIFVFLGMMVSVGLLLNIMSHVSPLWIGLCLSIIFLILLILADIAFNASWKKGEIFGAPADFIEKLENEGLLISTKFKANRVFQVEEYEDEGLHYFVELEDKSVLYLTGQYLYDYIAIEDENDEDCEPAIFPCTDFTVRRHRDGGFVVDLQCRGTLLEPVEWVEYGQGKVPEDGDIITDTSFDELKKAHR